MYSVYTVLSTIGLSSVHARPGVWTGLPSDWTGLPPQIVLLCLLCVGLAMPDLGTGLDSLLKSAVMLSKAGGTTQ